MTTAKAYLPKFERGAIAFRLTLKGTLEAWNVFGSRTTKRGHEYEIMRKGFLFWELEQKLLTGWEPDFPGYEMVDWGDITPVATSPDEQLPDDEYVSYLETRESELVELYSDLATQWEGKPAAIPLEGR